MNVYLSADWQDLLPGDMIAEWVLRSDLAPVPRTLELSVRLKDDIDKRLKVGASLWTGWEGLEYEIVKADKPPVAGLIQGRDPLGTLTVTALLKSCVRVAYRRERAVISENARLGDLYRACGATAAIADDFTVARFACFIGDVPSVHLARAMQEEGAALLHRDRRLSVARLQDLFRQEPKDFVGQADTAGRVDSEFLERHEIPAFYSLNAAGEFVFGAYERTRATQYLPRTNERALRNMTRVLVTRRVLNSDLAEEINAGDLLDVNGERLVVITAAHLIRQQEGITESNSKFWVGSLSA